MIKRRTFFLFSAFIALFLSVGDAYSQGKANPGKTNMVTTTISTAFTYQGHLKDSGAPANGAYDFEFELYDDLSGGSQVGTTINLIEETVTEGLFSVLLDFGDVYDGTALYLNIRVRPGSSTGAYTTLSPRQALNASPYALSLRPGATIYGNFLGLEAIATNGFGLIGQSDLPGGSGIGVYGLATASAGATRGVYGWSGSTSGTGVSGYASASSGFTNGVYGENDSINGNGVSGYATASSGYTHGVYGESISTSGTGVYGYAPSVTGASYGVYGQSDSPEGSGIYGLHWSTTGWQPGVRGETNSSSDYATGVTGRLLNSTPGNFSAGVRGLVLGTGDNGYGVWGSHLGGGTGVYGEAISGTGVQGVHTDSTGTEPGVIGETLSTSSNATGVVGRVTSASSGAYSAGVRGVNEGTSNNGIGVYGEQFGSGWGVYGTADSGLGVYGHSTSGVGVFAHSESGNPIEAYGSSLGDREFYVSNTGDVFADGTYSSPAADFAELLPAVGDLKPGDVLVIGSDGKLTHSTTPYQSNVVGVYSTRPGFLGGAGEANDYKGKIPLAIVGVVPVNVSAENGSIQPGDLLTTSSIPGYAMRAGDFKVGTIIGKALETLYDGTGVIQIIVMLQ